MEGVYSKEWAEKWTRLIWSFFWNTSLVEVIKIEIASVKIILPMNDSVLEKKEWDDTEVGFWPI